MMVSNEGSLAGLIRWQATNIAWFTGLSTLTVASEYLAHDMLELPPLFATPATPIAVVGGAIGIFVSFRTNSAYDRWWEGRKLWGRLINTSRHFCSQIDALIKPVDAELAERMTRRHIAYVHLLKCLLRQQDPDEDEDFVRVLPETERAAVRGVSNPTHALLHAQQADFVDLANANKVSDLRLQQLDNSILHLLDIQGGCERIKKTPLPRGYGYIANQLVRIFAVLLPMAIVNDMTFMAIPITVVVCLAFALINEAGRVLEDPFTMFYNGLPLQAMSITIERDVRSRRGESELPPSTPISEHGILM